MITHLVIILPQMKQQQKWQSYIIPSSYKKSCIRVKSMYQQFFTFCIMELHLLINGQKCEIKFEKHHTFERVINLLKQNKVIPSEVEFDKIQIIGKDGKHYKKSNHVIQSLVPPETSKCQVKIKFGSSSISNIMGNNKESMLESQGVKKARLVDIVKGFFQKMQKREFKKLEKYQNHHEEIVSQVAQFAGKYQKLYALYLYYRDKIINLNKNQAEQLQEYRQKFSEIFKIQEQEGSSKLRQSVINDSIIQQQTSRIGMETRENLQQKQKEIQQLKDEIDAQKLILQEAINSYNREVSELNDKLTYQQQKYKDLQRNMDKLRQETSYLNFSLQENIGLVSKLQQQVDDLQTEKRNLMMQSRILKDESIQQLQKIKCQLQIKQKQNAQLESRYNLFQTRIEQLYNRNHILQDQNSSLIRKLQKLERELQQSKEENNDLRNNSTKLHKVHSLQLRTKRTTSFLEEISYEQPVLKLNECFNCDLANKFIQKQQQYLHKKLSKLTKIIHHPANLNIPKSKILKKLKGKSDILLVCITQQDRVVGGFSSLAIDHFCTKEDAKLCKAFVFNIEDSQINLLTLKTGKHPIKQDKDFFILGQEEIMIDYQTLTLQSRLVTMSSNQISSFNDPLQRRKLFLSPKQKSIVKLKEYWVFECTFE